MVTESSRISISFGWKKKRKKKLKNNAQGIEIEVFNN